MQSMRINHLLIELLGSIAVDDAPAVAADQSTGVIAVVALKRIDRPGDQFFAPAIDQSSSVRSTLPVSLLLFRCCCCCCCCCNQRLLLLIKLLSSIAPAIIGATDRSTAVVSAIDAEL